MKFRDSFWQGHFGYWQPLFIHQNLLTIGYTAWNGYLNAQRGIVVCTVTDPIHSSIDWNLDTVAFHPEFLAQAQMDQYLLGLELERDAVNMLLNAIATYDPAQSIVLLIIGNGEVDINLLQDLTISPVECYTQVQRRWSDFQLDAIPLRKKDTA